METCRSILTSHAFPRRQRGAALILVLLLSMVCIASGLVAASIAQTEMKVAHNDLLGHQALAIAEAGISHGLRLVASDSADGLSDELRLAGDSGLGQLGDRSRTLDDGTYRFRAFGGDQSADSSDGYYVRAVDNFDEPMTALANDPLTDVDRSIVLVSIGRIGTAERRVEVRIGMKAGGPDCALVTEGSLTISGNPTITGARGCAHANKDLEIKGDPTLEKGATASGSLTIDGNPDLEGQDIKDKEQKEDYGFSHSRKPKVMVPSVRPFKFGPQEIDLAQAVAEHPDGYRLDADCKAFIGPGQGGTAWTCDEVDADCTGGTEVPIPEGWECSADSGAIPGALWKVSKNSVQDGIFFVEGWVDISGNPGSIDAPWNVSIIALNSISVSGNPSVEPFTETGTLRNLLFVSGNDIGISGNPNNKYTGAILAHQQIKLNGNPHLVGFIVAEDAKTTWEGDPAPLCQSGKDILCDDKGGNAVSGNFNLSFDGLDTVAFGDAVERQDYKEVRR